MVDHLTSQMTCPSLPSIIQSINILLGFHHVPWLKPHQHSHVPCFTAANSQKQQLNDPLNNAVHSHTNVSRLSIFLLSTAAHTPAAPVFSSLLSVPSSIASLPLQNPESRPPKLSLLAHFPSETRFEFSTSLYSS